ncbi:hypothetical protein MNBD_GAMMA13-2117, partial [hydrothermal vent metagenome]
MHLDNYYSRDNDHIVFTRQQASDFAKNVADDFNPIHNINAKRFCVPGDLLFSLALQHYGLSQHMYIQFSGMVTDATPLAFPDSDAAQLEITDTTGKAYLSLEHSGDTSHNTEQINTFTHRYVQFSGQTFPHILVPLMADHQLMINPDRPLVIYESMSITLDSLAFETPELVQQQAELDIKGKRGSAHIKFSVKNNGSNIGYGEKTMALSGLRPYDQDTVDTMVADYMAS